jgi:hypothetical protein
VEQFGFESVNAVSQILGFVRKGVGVEVFHALGISTVLSGAIFEIFRVPSLPLEKSKKKTKKTKKVPVV